ncbi:nucleosome-remodeling factor subunit BPTF [Brachionus plicatilis]|uniref:Nucleosome-remodeling factor subunit BPTF n=1 Tax=Brachionus plicatilis TaxID=10195 RepID=A0A3M7SCS7_BRAPC|nr:nucleosome-remodeling factor subunit BPTF [Brachionus plicatilis]
MSNDKNEFIESSSSESDSSSDMSDNESVPSKTVQRTRFDAKVSKKQKKQDNEATAPKDHEPEIIEQQSQNSKTINTVYNDLRDSCFQFLNNFDEDGFEMLRSIIHSIDTNWFCEKCKCPIFDENHDSIACDYCYKWSHFKCVGISKFKANKLDKWFCNQCS